MLSTVTNKTKQNKQKPPKQKSQKNTRKLWEVLDSLSILGVVMESWMRAQVQSHQDVYNGCMHFCA